MREGILLNFERILSMSNTTTDSNVLVSKISDILNGQEKYKHNFQKELEEYIQNNPNVIYEIEHEANQYVENSSANKNGILILRLALILPICCAIILTLVKAYVEKSNYTEFCQNLIAYVKHAGMITILSIPVVYYGFILLKKINNDNKELYINSKLRKIILQKINKPDSNKHFKELWNKQLKPIIQSEIQNSKNLEKFYDQIKFKYEITDVRQNNYLKKLYKKLSKKSLTKYEEILIQLIMIEKLTTCWIVERDIITVKKQLKHILKESTKEA